MLAFARLKIKMIINIDLLKIIKSTVRKVKMLENFENAYLAKIGVLRRYKVLGANRIFSTTLDLPENDGNIGFLVALLIFEKVLPEFNSFLPLCRNIAEFQNTVQSVGENGSHRATGSNQPTDWTDTKLLTGLVVDIEVVIYSRRTRVSSDIENVRLTK